MARAVPSAWPFHVKQSDWKHIRPGETVVRKSLPLDLKRPWMA